MDNQTLSPGWNLGALEHFLSAYFYLLQPRTLSIGELLPKPPRYTITNLPLLVHSWDWHFMGTGMVGSPAHIGRGVSWVAECFKEFCAYSAHETKQAQSV